MKARIATGLGAVLLLLSTAIAEEGASDSSHSRARILFRLHCASCHGATAEGDGALAKSLKVRPPDLTKIAKRNKGFRRDEIRQIIDGRTEVDTHGTRYMPVWGLSLRDPGRMDDQETEIADQIAALVDYLLSIQNPPVEAEDPS